MRLLVTFPHSLGAPGGGTQDCMQLCTHLARAGAEVRVMPVGSLGPTRFPRPHPTPEYDGADEAQRLRAEGIEVVGVKRHPLHYLLDGLPVRRAVQRLLGERPFDAVLGWWNEVQFLPSLLQKHGVLFAMNAAASYGPLFTAPGARTPLRRLRTRLSLTGPLRRADVVFARSEFTRGEMIRLAGVEADRVRVAYLGVEPEFSQVQRQPDSSAGPITRILFSGTLVPEKGLFDALEALSRLRDRPWTFQLAGWGDAEEVRRRAAALGIGDRIELLGRLDRAGMLEALSRAQLALQPSHTESFGLANAEAQAAGLAVVACGVAAVPEVVLDGRTGWLVPPKDPERLSQALALALADPEETRRRGAAGRARVTREFHWGRTAETTLEGLRAGLARRAGR